MTFHGTPAWLGRALIVAAVLATAACERPAAAPPSAANTAPEEPVPVEDGAISVAPVAPEPPPRVGKKPAARPKVDWSKITLESGEARIACDLDYATAGDGEPLPALDRASIEARLAPCAEPGLLRLRYRGRIEADFASLVQRVAAVADELGIAKRVLDLDSAGGMVEDAIRAGDLIAETRWTLWVREDSLCHSACVFVLSAGDVRRVAGKVGIHRIIRMSSTATTRAELNAELRLVHERVRNYFERNGTSVAVADMMMSVPNRSLRLLTADELLRYGLDGVNPAQDDLDRLHLLRECGEDFVARRDAFARAFDRHCRGSTRELDALNACGLALRRKYGFPDSTCPVQSPLSEFDLAQADPEPPAEDAATPPADAPPADAPSPEAPSADASPSEASPAEASPPAVSASAPDAASGAASGVVSGAASDAAGGG